ncbi:MULTISPECIES: DevA family ABC transporter ATP-binding protein [Nostocales]|uniref:ATP-binding cassette domain-containing protein n=1 Tax=Dolichospermum flos-aquae UHCC 0037 TaxID=2590026 RepID=A0ACC7S8V7_DOLFA|nr:MULTISPECIES: DevA family ABC transporter ATP-binding protein [Nostocales]MBO1067344.1 ATP-binding cassette domain-containing protein [Anabaena sp. 54]MTJ44988.1 ATP-binding cassette domain-containing protein [Dolichospermum flos-aquae UHCC 0037]
MSKEATVIINYLNHYYGKGSLRKQVLFDINLEIKAGEIIILTGQSGSGKTTLISLIGGLRSIQQGSLQTLGQELYRANEEKMVKVRRQVGYIFQAHNLLEFMTARENVQMSVELHDHLTNVQAKAKAEMMLKEVGLEHRINYYPRDLSGGQKQRVAIARSLVSNPKLVLADEPTASLDSHTGREIVELMQKLAKEQGCTILLVTHDNRILDIANRILDMEDGRLKIK